ncbi:DUF6059 family protein [Streptomyces sp. NPDC006283]|uniref:DUF6059 family protein n=1 Tax=Streptomyces sp. NPDC006283 TaxID=3156741 RepID=UPI0033A06839
MSSPARPWPLRLARRCLRPLWQGLVACGAVYLAGESERAAPRRPTVLLEPPAGHPERLRPDVPLTALERALLREWERAG